MEYIKELNVEFPEGGERKWEVSDISSEDKPL